MGERVTWCWGLQQLKGLLRERGHALPASKVVSKRDLLGQSSLKMEAVFILASQNDPL